MKKLFIYKHSNVVDEFNGLFGEEYNDVSDGVNPYIKQICNQFRNGTNYHVTIIGLGTVNQKYVNDNFTLISFNVNSTNKFIKFFQLLKFNIAQIIQIIFLKPATIISLTTLKPISLVLLYCYLTNKKIHIFLTASIKRDFLLNQKFFVWLLQQVTDKIYSRSNENIEILKRNNYRKEATIFSPKSVDLTCIKLESTLIKSDINFKVLFIGRLVPVKGIQTLLEVAKLSKNNAITFYIIGSGSLESDIKSFVHDNALTNIVLLGYIENEKIYSYINDCDLGFIPSLSEGVCKVAREFLLLNKPIVGSDVGGISEIVEQEVTGLLLEPYDNQGFYNALIRIKNDERFMQWMIKNSMSKRYEFRRKNEYDFDSYLTEIIN